MGATGGHRVRVPSESSTAGKQRLPRGLEWMEFSALIENQPCRYVLPDFLALSISPVSENAFRNLIKSNYLEQILNSPVKTGMASSLLVVWTPSLGCQYWRSHCVAKEEYFVELLYTWISFAGVQPLASFSVSNVQGPICSFQKWERSPLLGLSVVFSWGKGDPALKPEFCVWTVMLGHAGYGCFVL